MRKKKLLALTVAAGLLAPLVAAPYSTGIAGLDSYITAGKAQAADAVPGDSLKQQLTRLYQALKDNGDLAELLKPKLSAINTEQGRINNRALVTEVWNRIDVKKAAYLTPADVNLVTQENVLRLVLDLAISFDADGDEVLDTLMNDAEYRAILDQLIVLGGYAGGLDDVGVQDISDFVAAIDPTLRSKLETLSVRDLLNLRSELATEYARLLADTSLKFGQVLKNLGITADDLEKVTIRFLGLLFVPEPPAPPPPPPVNVPVQTEQGVEFKPSPKTSSSNGVKTTEYDFSRSELDAIKELLKDEEQGQKAVVLNVDADADVTRVGIPGPDWQAFSEADDSVDLVMNLAGDVSYQVSFNSADAKQLADDQGVALEDLTFFLTMSKVTGEDRQTIVEQAEEDGVDILTEIYDFTLTVEINGQMVEIDNFNGIYGSRTIPLGGDVNTEDTDHLTGAVINNGQFGFVPTSFVMIDGKPVAILKRTGNSQYAVIYSEKTYTDIKGHWAADDIELLASKLLVNGVSPTEFAPEAEIKRSEFAALLVRALGLVAESGSSTFKDVKATDWASGEINAAVKAGLIDGFEDGTFRPEASITREQMAVMISRALEVAGQQITADPAKLSKFEDQSSVASWASQAVAENVVTGIMEGTSATTLAPKADATRAEAVAVFKRLLKFTKYID